MQALIELAPIAAFFIAYCFGGIYIATAVLMAAMGVLLLVDITLQRRVPPMHAASAALVFVLGAATLLFHNKHFIQLKPTALYWLFAIAFLASFWIGKRTLTERIFSAALQEQIAVPERIWRMLNGLWVAFYGVLGAVNLAIATYTSERVWVYSKIALIVVALLFSAAQVVYLFKRGTDNPTPVQEPPAA